LEQTCPLAHLVPHAPQLSPSTFVSTQRLPHLTVPPPQLTAHAPCEQTSPVPHLVPHAPQFSGSRPTTVHTPPQTCEPAPQPAAESMLASSAPVKPVDELLQAPMVVAAQIMAAAAAAPWRPFRSRVRSMLNLLG
jgi:hypothetical protein